MTEQDLQKLIRLEISKQKLGVTFRCNVGQGWTGKRIQHNHDGSITIFEPRIFRTGLPRGFSDLFGVAPGGQAFFLEIKTPQGRVRPEQHHFLAEIKKRGALGGIVRSVEDAINILGGYDFD